MGTNNYLEIPWPDGGTNLVQFKWGVVWELQYKIGDRISWEQRDRPAEADGVVWIGGCAPTGDYESRHINGRDYDVAVLAYFRIKFDNDTIMVCEPISELDFEALENKQR